MDLNTKEEVKQGHFLAELLSREKENDLRKPTRDRFQVIL